MPRRDLLSEEKRKRLMQEHEQLQNLMLQSRSSVRRSSLKEHPEENLEEAKNEIAGPKKKIETPVAQTINETEAPRKKPLTEKEFFATGNTAYRNNVQAPLTENDIFKPAKNTFAKTQPAEKKITTPIVPDAKQEVLHTAKEPVVDETRISEARPFERVAGAEYKEHYSDFFEKKRKPSKAITYTLLLLAALLVGFGGYYFYQTNQPKKPSITQQPAPPVVQQMPQPQTTSPSLSNAPVKNNNGADATTNLPVAINSKTIVAKKKSTPIVKPSVAATHTEPATTATLAKYKVIAKAYFHNEPDETTRRKAFMTHWDDAVLTPLDDKNDFIYITFTNHLGQTSKGWLRKSDLRRID